MSTPQLFLPNYAYSTSRSYAPSTQVSDYGGVAEAARIYPKRSVTFKVVEQVTQTVLSQGDAPLFGAFALDDNQACLRSKSPKRSPHNSDRRIPVS